MTGRMRCTVVYLVLALALAAAASAGVSVGSVPVAPGDIWSILTGGSPSTDALNIVWRIRLPRVVMAGLLGGALAVSGLLLQAFFNNPIAGPFVLGISHGAKMVVALVMIVFIGGFGAVSSWMLVGAAFVGALATTGLMLLVSRRIDGMATLLVAGVMVGYACSAVTEFLITFASDADIVNLHGWSQGSFSGSSWAGVQVATIVCVAGMAAVLLLAKPMEAYQLGEAHAQSVGVDTRRFRAALIVLSSVLSATVTAFAGPISFVGIAVPFLVKRALGTSKPLTVIPATFLGGAAFCLVADLVARMAFAPTELNISTVTAVFGAPVVMFMLVTMKARRSR